MWAAIAMIVLAGTASSQTAFTGAWGQIFPGEEQTGVSDNSFGNYRNSGPYKEPLVKENNPSEKEEENVNENKPTDTLGEYQTDQNQDGVPSDALENNSGINQREELSGIPKTQDVDVTKMREPSKEFGVDVEKNPDRLPPVGHYEANRNQQIDPESFRVPEVGPTESIGLPNLDLKNMEPSRTSGANNIVNSNFKEGLNRKPTLPDGAVVSPNAEIQSNTRPHRCPIRKLTGDQIALICPTGFIQHSRYCDIFYQCTVSDDFGYKVINFNCPFNTGFDEYKEQCLPLDKLTVPCDDKELYNKNLATPSIN